MNLFINSLSKEEIITSYNFARKCDVVFSEVVARKSFEKLNLKNFVIIDEDDYKIFYMLKDFKVYENQVIFCNTYMVKNLFNILRKEKNLKNIKLVTSQTDISISESLFKMKPQCISKWYSINIDYEDRSLISIPLGLSNEYSPKNIFKENYLDKVGKKLVEKNNKLYVNFQKNTNIKERGMLGKNLMKKDFVIMDEPNLQINEYLQKLIKNKYVFAPHGNGIDTHRIWETLYAGSIPVTKEHINFKSFSDLPIVQIEDYLKIDISLLDEISNNFNSEAFNNEKLKLSYWMKVIRNENIEDTKSESNFTQSEIRISYFINSYHLRERILSRIKKIKYNLLRIKKLLTIT